MPLHPGWALQTPERPGPAGWVGSACWVAAPHPSPGSQSGSRAGPVALCTQRPSLRQLPWPASRPVVSLGKASEDALLFALAQEGLAEAVPGGHRSPVAGVSPLPARRQGSGGRGSAACDSVDFQGKGLLRVGEEAKQRWGSLLRCW